MDLVWILRLVNLVFLIIIAVLLFINRKAEKQTLMRVAFVILVLLFAMQMMF